MTTKMFKRQPERPIGLQSRFDQKHYRTPDTSISYYQNKLLSLHQLPAPQPNNLTTNQVTLNLQPKLMGSTNMPNQHQASITGMKKLSFKNHRHHSSHMGISSTIDNKR